jgi:hypothetical protein
MAMRTVFPSVLRKGLRGLREGRDKCPSKVCMREGKRDLKDLLEAVS